MTLWELFLENSADAPAWSGVVLAACVLGEDGVGSLGCLLFLPPPCAAVSIKAGWASSFIPCFCNSHWAASLCWAPC